MKRSVRSFPILLLFPAALAVSASCSTSNGGGGGDTLGGNPFLITGSASGLGGKTGGGVSVGSSSGDDIATPNGGGPGAGGGGSATDLACPSFGDLECGSMALRPSTVGANVLVVLDRSGSMKLIVDEAKEIDLWTVVSSALSTTLVQAAEAISFGLELFPMKDDGPVVAACAVGNDSTPCCAVPSMNAPLAVPIAPGTEPRSQITKMLGDVSYGGGTPTAAALSRALHYYSEGPGKDLMGQRFVMLTTDGGPNCYAGLKCEKQACTRNIDGVSGCDLATNCCDPIDETKLDPPKPEVFDVPLGCLDDSGTLEQVQALRDIGVETFVIGLPGSELYGSQLDAFADAGGRARVGADEKYYKVSAEAANDSLLAAFHDITTQLIKSCDVPLTHPVTPTKLNVAVNCDLIPGVAPPAAGAAGDTAATSNGWWLDAATEPGVVRIQGPICDMIQAEGAERVDLLEGCDTFE